MRIMGPLDRMFHLLSFIGRARAEYRRELDSRIINWDKLPDDQPKGSTSHAFSVEHFPIANEFRPVAHVTVIEYKREYRSVGKGRRARTVERWAPNTTVTKLYLHVAPKWLGPSSIRNFGITVECGLADGVAWMAPSEAKSREEAPPCKSMAEALHIIELYQESALGHGIQTTRI